MTGRLCLDCDNFQEFKKPISLEVQDEELKLPEESRRGVAISSDDVLDVYKWAKGAKLRGTDRRTTK